MTILFFARRFYPQIGGVEKHVMEVGKRLVAMGHRVVVVTEVSSPVIPTDAGIQKREAKKDMDSWFAARNDNINGIKIIRIPGGRDDKLKKFRIWRSLWRLRKIIEQADIIHCHDVFFWYLPFRILYPRKSVYTTFHGYESYPIRKNAILIRKLSEKLSWGNICIGDFIPKWYGTKSTYVSYGAVFLAPSPSQSLSKVEGYNLSPQKKGSAVFIGRLDNQTGSLEYATAVELIREKYPKFEVLFVGDGEHRKQIEKVATVTGFEKDPERYLAQYRFAFVSRYLSILEAMAAKRLVFALYDNPVKEDYLKLAPYARWIVIVKDAKELAEKVDYFMTHPDEENKLVEKAYIWVKKQSWDAMVNLYLRLWKKM